MPLRLSPHSAIMADSGAGKPPATAITGTLEEKSNNGDEGEIRAAGVHSPLHDASRGLPPEAAGMGRPRGHSNSDSDSSAVDSDEEEVSVGASVGVVLAQKVALGRRQQSVLCPLSSFSPLFSFMLQVR